MGLFRRRRIRKHARETLRHARHVVHMRGDLVRPEAMETFCDRRAMLKDAIKHGNIDAMESETQELEKAVATTFPPRRHTFWRENLEIIVVALAVAMAFRAYFFQPFKIPTGSMQPTLFGIHSEASDQPTSIDRTPLKYLKWLITGEFYHEIKAELPGTMSRPMKARPGYRAYYVGTRRYEIPSSARPNVQPGQEVRAGQVLWAGTVRAGDHIFVNKVTWNFRGPRRGDVIVFDTRAITGLPQGTHYIKRLVGLPGERISITPPYLMVGGERLAEPESIRRICEREGDYAGYRLVERSPFDQPESKQPLFASSDVFVLGDREYFACGDNTRNSRDSRYWGAVPERNLVGPAGLVYWPFTERWGRLD